MATNHPQARRRILVGGLVAAGLAFFSGESRADRISLRGGGLVRGKLVEEPAHPDAFLFIGESGKTPIVFKKAQIVQVVPEKGPLDEYVALRAKPRPDAESEHQLGLWCEEHDLPDLADVHFEAALGLDSTFGPSHEKLGHIFRDGRWLNGDELKEAQGFVKYKGRWVLPEEKERKEAQQATVAESATWTKRIQVLREAYLAGPEARSREAERRLLSIDEPVAVAPVLRVLGEDSLPAIRALAAKVLGNIAAPSASSGLVRRLLAESDERVRQATMEQIARRDSSEIIPGLIKALRASQPEVVNRAAWGLGNLNAQAVVPKLVPALITIENRVVLTGGEEAPSGNVNLGFNTVSPTPGFGNLGGVSIPVLTPPVVGPGVAAFGATSVPYGALNYPTLSIGSGAREPTYRILPIEHHNAEVLAALVKLTGQDFGFEIGTWKRWIATSFRIESAPSRRVPQP